MHAYNAIQMVKDKNMKQLFFCMIVACFAMNFCLAQTDQEFLVGTVSFVTSNNIYVKFENTEVIQIGAVLQLNNSDCLKVTEKSSISVVCTILNDCVVKKDDKVSYVLPVNIEPTEVIDDNVDETIPAEVVQPKEVYPKEEPLYKESIRGRISVASYNTFSDLRDDRHRLQTRFSLNANHIDGGKFSVESYLAYRNNLAPSGNYSGRTNIFNVYNLNISYDATQTLSTSMGRKINRKASTIGANDGLQVEKYFGNFYVGGVVGFRPDFFDYGFNSDLLQYGGYVGYESKAEKFKTTTTAGAMEQTNAGITDRRYVFFQHSSNIAGNLNLFASGELDVFGDPGFETRLTNLYVSARYRFSKAVNVMASFDSRKRIIYYETFRTQIEEILDEDLARQGIRARVNIRPVKGIYLGASYSSRSQSDNQNKSDNIYGYITFSNLPKIGGRLNGAYNINTSTYLKSNIFSTRYSREIFKNSINADIYYRLAMYDYENQDVKYNQNYYGLQINYRMSRSWQFNISGEMSQFEEENSYRIYAQLTKRFLKKKKK